MNPSILLMADSLDLCIVLILYPDFLHCSDATDSCDNNPNVSLPGDDAHTTTYQTFDE